MKLTSRQRLLRTLRGEKPDRVPISLYEFDGFYDDWIYDYPEYVNILEYAKDKTDKMYFWSPPGDKSVLFYGVMDEQDIETTEWNEGKSIYTKTQIKTPRGKLSSLSRQDEGVHTTWTIEHLCKDEKDAEKILSLPYLPWRPPVDSFFELDRELGDSGIVMGDIPDALCLTADIFGFTRFLTTYIDNPKLIFKLMDFFQERIYDFLEYLLTNGAVTLYRIVGPEYATPPYLSPKEFDKLVTAYDRELINLLHRYGGFARLHSHGKISKVMKSFLEMEIDATDPVEPPPDGDVELKEVREILGEKVTLIGNIEEKLFHMGGKEDMEKAVRKAIEEGASGGPFILCPTAMPLTTPLARKIQENIIHYIDCGVKYGEI
ncbi:hypothetical protein DRP98_09395 [candidate division KSB1 bacterium]|nr:MAG: hypothetical protein DRP98_09395 [candidate division KSB1 bacterium]